MVPKVSGRKKELLKAVAIFEIVSGLTGLLMVGAACIGRLSNVPGTVLLYGAFLIATVVAGIVLWRRWKDAITLSILIQLLQIPVIQMDSFWLNLGGAMSFTISGTWYAGGGAGATLLGINVLALAALFLLLWGRSDLQDAPVADGGVEQLDGSGERIVRS
jgi:hypothetical protein